MMKKLSANDVNVTDPVDVNVDDKSVLTEGMILDSRIVKHIDELDITSDEVALAAELSCLTNYFK